MKKYVEASHVVGEGHMYIAFRQILPNCLSPVIIQATISLGIEMLVLAALSFLGLGAPQRLTGALTSTWHVSIWRLYRTWRSFLAWRFPLRSWVLTYLAMACAISSIHV